MLFRPAALAHGVGLAAVHPLHPRVPADQTAKTPEHRPSIVPYGARLGWPEGRTVPTTACSAASALRWAVTGSNRRPPACKAGALPAELTARRVCKIRESGE